MFEAVNLALSSLPGNRAAVRCIEGATGYTIEWLPYQRQRVRD
jgi:hypothetical protein